MALQSNALTTRARLKTWLGLTTTDDDALLDSIIQSVTEWVERYCDTTFLQTVYTNQVYDGTGTNRLVLQNRPVSSTATFSIEERSSNLNIDSWSEVNTEKYHVDYTAGIVEMVYDAFSEVPRKYRIDYTAGYDYDQATKTLESVGLGDLEMAVWKLCNNAYRKRRDTEDIQSETIGDYSVTYAKSASDDMEIQAILNKFRRTPPY